MKNERSFAKEITEGFEALKSMRNNEPVAWMMKAREPSLHSPDYITFEIPTRDMKVSYHPHPLYTHPVKEKEITDEEIADALYVADITLNNLSDGDISMERIKAFARAILRKAQEK